MLENVLIEIGAWQLTLQGLLAYSAFVIVFFLLYTIVKKQLWDRITKFSGVDEDSLAILKKIFLWLVILVFVLSSLSILGVDYLFAKGENFDISLSLIIKAFIVLQIARFFDWIFVNVLIENYYNKRDTDNSNKPTKIESRSSAAQIVKYILYTIVAIVLIRQFGLDFTIPFGSKIIISISDVLSAILVLLFARLALWVITQIFLYGLYRRNKIDVGAQYAINQLLKYVVYIIAFFIALSRLGIDMTLVWGGAAALLVGIGLGLQQTFNDFFSGIVLLFERSVSVGDSIEVGMDVAIVKKIGLRSSELETRGNMTIIVPNSQLVNEKVTNWNHYDEKTRFSVLVGADYASDPQEVKKILLGVASSNPYLLDYPAPNVRLISFGDNSLDFELIFFSRNYFIIEDIKSDIRFEIERLFKENNISIPFPQRTVHLKKD